MYNKTTFCINIFMVLYKLSHILIYEQVFLQGHIILYNKVISSESNIKDMDGAFYFIIFYTNWILLLEAYISHFLKGNINYLDSKIMGHFGFLLYTFLYLKTEREKRQKEREGGREANTTGKCAFKSTVKTTCPCTL